MDPAHLNKLFSISNWLFLILCYCQNSIGDLWNTLVPTIRSSIMGIPVVISVDTIAGVIKRVSEGRFVYGLSNKKSPWIPIVNRTLFNSSTKGKYKELSMRTKMLLKIQNENLLPKGSGGDKPSLDHKVFLHFFLTHLQTHDQESER